MQATTHFRDLGLTKGLLQAVEAMGYTQPTPIQQQAIPLVLDGHDVVGIAQTGTGKTAAYMLPLLRKLSWPEIDEPRCLILAPTRELVVQLHQEVQALGQYTDLRSVAIYGSKGSKHQEEELRQGVDIVISTPGRAWDLYKNYSLVLKRLKHLVLDEADRMMDMGFLPQLRRLLEVVPRKRQNLLFTATWPEVVERLSHEFLEFPKRVEVTPPATAAVTVDQQAFPTPNLNAKIQLLALLLHEYEADKVMIFTKTKKAADDVGKFIRRKVDPEVRIIHGNKGQNTRLNAFEAFRQGEVKTLVSTDVSARGVDIRDVELVINFDLPRDLTDYVHRVGRTGRAMKSGKAFTFCTPPDLLLLEDLEAMMQQPIGRQALPAAVEVQPTPPEEAQLMARALDAIKRHRDPTFKGAFHEKKERKRG